MKEKNIIDLEFEYSEGGKELFITLSEYTGWDRKDKVNNIQIHLKDYGLVVDLLRYITLGGRQTYLKFN